MRLLKHFGQDNSGAYAVEFALIAFPFFITILAILEISIMFFAGVALENGVTRIARQVRTGEVSTGSMSAAQFKQLLCDQVSPLLACDQRLQVDVRTYQQFSQTDFTPPINPDGSINMAFQFNTGAAGDVVLVRGFYAWQPSTPFLGSFFTNMADTKSKDEFA